MIPRASILVLIPLLAVPLGAAEPATLQRLQEAALASDYAYTQVAHLCDNIGPRMSGSPQYAKAAEYVAAELRRDGLDVRLEPVTLPRWVRGAESAELVAFPGMAPGTTQKLAVTALGGSGATPSAGIDAAVVAVRDFDELERLGRQGVEGRIVVFDARFDRRLSAAGFGLDAYGDNVQYRGKGASAAARLGAVAALVRSAGGAEYRLPHTGAMYEEAKIPAGALAAEDADLVARLAAQGEVRLHLLLTPHTETDVVSANVVADLKGTEHPEQVVLVSGHLDSWDLGTGAIDDAAGVGVAMAVGHLVKQLGLHPRRTIRIVAWADEELTERGGIGYFRAHRAEIPDHVAAIEVDLGADHPVGLEYDATPAAAAQLAPIMKVLAAQGALLLRPTADSAGADITPLSVAGVPTFGPLEDSRTYFDYHHSAADTLDKIRPAELREHAALAAVLTWGLANMDDRIAGAVKPMPDWLKAIP